MQSTTSTAATPSIWRACFSDGLTGFQVVGGLVVGLTQAYRFIESIEGQLLSVLALMQVYMLLNYRLARAGHIASPTRITTQTMFVYRMWLGLLSIEIVMLVVNPGWHWLDNDTRTALLALLGLPVVGGFALVRRLSLADPMIKSGASMFCRFFPQLLMAHTIFEFGGGGLPLAAVVFGNLTISLRALQAYLAMREAAWERNLFWLFITELMTELSWAVVSIAWIYRWYIPV